MAKIKVFQSNVSAESFKSKRYSEIKFFNTFLDYQALDVYRYQPLKTLLKTNVENLFVNDIYQDYGINNYNGSLAYGEVQSGKTSNMLCSTMFAYDYGFKYVFIFTGNITALHNQTINRFGKEFSNFRKYCENNYQNNQELKYARDKEISFYPAINIRDIRELEITVSFVEQLEKNNDLNVFFVLKNTSSYEKVVRILELSGNLKKRNSILILDDESDWGFKSGSYLDNSPKLFNDLSEIKKICETKDYYLKYIAFTATPYKIFESSQSFINNINNVVRLQSKQFQDWMTNDYVETNDPFYCGINIFHPSHKVNYKSEVIENLINRGFVSIINNEVNEQQLLILSLLTFLINSYAYKITTGKFGMKKNLYGLYFSDVVQSKHDKDFSNLVNLLPILNKVMEEKVFPQFKSVDYRTWNQSKIDFILFFLEIMVGVIPLQLSAFKDIIIAKLSQFSYSQVNSIFLYIHSWIKAAIKDKNALIVKMSGNEEDGAKFDQKQPLGELNSIFIIGGYKISRGITFDNLVFECITKKSDKNDSTLQRARWFGYRSLDLLKNMTIILSEEVNKSFEESIRNDVNWREAIETYQKDLNHN